jgi:NADPH:quinone reductase-like Zn-dependent oxidoreductase
MKAIVYREFGSPDVLQLADIDTPSPKDNELLIRLCATTVKYGDIVARNFANTPAREFHMPMLLWLPARIGFGLTKPSTPILGAEFAGDVAAVGKDVNRFRVGDAVFGYLGQRMGAYAEYVCMPEDGAVATKPANTTYEEAATVPYGGLMAMSLLSRVDIREGQKVLVNGASGSIGSHALQLAKHRGAEVTGVCSTPNIAFVEALGADHVIDYTQQDFTQSGEVYDLIFDVLGKTSLARCRYSLKEDGRLLLASFKLKHLLEMVRTSMGGGRKVTCALASETQEDLVAIKGLVEAGAVKTVIDRRYPLEKAADAHRYVESGQKQGNVVITIGPGEHAAPLRTAA